MFSFSHLKIAQRVMMLALVAVAGIAVTVAIFLVQRNAEEGHRAGVEAITAQQGQVGAIADRLRESLIESQQFLLTHDVAMAELVVKDLELARQSIRSLDTTGSADLGANATALIASIDTLDQAFGKLVADHKEMGLDPSQGLEGAMRSAVHSIEGRIADVDNAELRASMLMMRRHEKDFLLRRDASYMDKHAAEAEHFTQLAKGVFPPGPQRMRVNDSLKIYTAAFKFYAEASLREAADREVVSQSYESLLPNIQRLVEGFDAHKAGVVAENVSATAMIDRIAIGLIGATVALLLAGVWWVGRSISRPVVAVTRAMRVLASGDTAITVPSLGQRNEFGEMAAALEVFRHGTEENHRLQHEAEASRARAEGERQRLQAEAEAEASARLAEATAGLAEGLRRLAAGDLSRELTVPFSSEFEALRADLNQTTRELSQVMRAINQSSQAIDNDSREISDGANDLARRTAEQAASLEETAAALEQITANVQNSTKRTEEARGLAGTAAQDARRSVQLVTEADHAMARIEESSRRIASIIGVIDEIAFQTNLLALNAGVEAARAGEAGKGFAVVAQEVRELAQRSASAAKEIKTLIQASGQEVAEGANRVRETGAVLTEIGAKVEAMNTHMDAIAVSASEQSSGIAEVNRAINAMDQTTQQNAAMVEENSAASSALQGEAGTLKEMVSRFRLAESREQQSAAQQEWRRAG